MELNLQSIQTEIVGEKDDGKNYSDATFARHGTHFTTSNGNTYLWKNMSLEYMF